MSSTRERKEAHDEPAMSLEELARRMLAMPVKHREEMTGSAKKRAKPRKKKR